MSAIVPAREAARARFGETAVLLAFAGTLFVSALLLFSVEPMFARLVLPKLGGSPSVWAVSLCFFQAALLAGYLYAHALNRYLTSRAALLAHLALLSAVGFALPIAIPVSFVDPPTDGAYLWLFGLLAAGVGLPFFAISATAPLLQAWFARTGGRHAADPYFLYGASNLGSLVALLAYPLAIEPALGLRAQGAVWSLGFSVLTVLIAFCGLPLLRAREPMTLAAAAPVSRVDAAAPDWRARLGWIALAFLPSGAVVAVTTYITTDVASAPFLWVGPLALYLATFIVVFRERLAFDYRLLTEGLPVALLGVVLTQGMLVSLLFALVAFFIAALLCHRELYLRRPGAARLTEFYIWMSVGGVLGGIFSALVAPQVFSTVFEFPLLMLLALLFRPGVLIGREAPLSWRRLAGVAAAMIGFIAGYKLAVHLGFLPADAIYRIALIGALIAGLVVIRKWPEHRTALVLAMITAAALNPTDLRTVALERSFFGVHRVMLSDDGKLRLLLHGTTTHGARRLVDDAGKAVVEPIPATYYEKGAPMARAVAIVRGTVAGRGTPMRVGVVGLGAGSLACHARPSEDWRYFEIDPVVARLARDPKHFDFLARCLPKADIEIGDARLTVARQSDGRFDLLVVDAFSSDSIPVHLLTTEALRMFADKIRSDGLLVLHTSNRNLDLAPAVASTIAAVPGLSAAIVDDPRPRRGYDSTPSQAVFVARYGAALAAVLREPGARMLEGGTVRPWTDDYADVLGAFLRKLGSEFGAQWAALTGGDAAARP